MNTKSSYQNWETNQIIWFDQNINVNPENLSNREHYEQSYLYGLNQTHKLAPTDSRFGYDHLRYYDSLTNKDKEHKEKKQKHKEKIVKKINKYWIEFIDYWLLNWKYFLSNQISVFWFDKNSW